MFISIPKDFFVPVLFSEDFRYNLENNTMEYDTEMRSDMSSQIDREKIADIDYTNNKNQDAEFTTDYIDNIKDRGIDALVINYIKSFMKFIYELEEANCLGKSITDIVKLLNYYGRSFINLYNDFINEVSMVRMPLHSSDIDGFIDHYIGKLDDIFNKILEEINCPGLDYDAVEATITNIADDARNILKEEIRNLNCNLVNRQSSCKSYNDIENSFKEVGNIYDTIDNEFVEEMKNR